MYEQRVRGESVVNGVGRLALDAETREQIAARLSQEAIIQGQRALVGLLAVPASFALGLAATVTWATAFLERGFETFERSLDQVTRAPMLSRGDEPSSEKSAQARS
jgi:hypothetical protein